MTKNQKNSRRYVVRRASNGRNWDVIDTLAGIVIEGGYFYKSSADSAADSYNRTSGCDGDQS